MFKRTDSDEDKVIITLNDEARQYMCNRKVLSKHSAYFNVMFNGNFIEKDKKLINIQEVVKNGFEVVIQQLDTDIYIDYDDLLDTLHCANMLQFDKIKSYCIARISKKLLLDYCLQVWFKADELNIHPLCETAKCKALLEFNYLKKNDSLLKLNINQLHTYLSSTLLYCDNELDVFEAGMRWWYEFSKNKSQSDEIEAKYLYAILNCVDFTKITLSEINTILTYPEINRSELKTILESVLELTKDQQRENALEIEEKVKQLYFKPFKRNKELYPCVLTSELGHGPGDQKRSRMLRADMNISYYDMNKQCMLPLMNVNIAIKDSYESTLKGFKMIGYKENVLLFGGEYMYGTAHWNKNVWIYYPAKNHWEVLSKMPCRRNFKSIIIDEKLFIIGGTGKYRILMSDDLFYYDFRKREWLLNIKLPRAMYDVAHCNYKNQLLIIPLDLKIEFGYLFNITTLQWQKLPICDPLGLVEEYPKNYLLFARNDTVYLKGSCYIEMKINNATLEVIQCEKGEPLHGDKIGYFHEDNKLYYFSKHDEESCKIYTLHCYDLDTKISKLLLQINDGVDTSWHIGAGCFSFFHYNLTKNSKCLGEFIF